LRITGSTHPGCRHDENQDSFRGGRLSDDSYWIVLCDGMGGASSGGMASEMAVDYLTRSIQQNVPEMETADEVRTFLLDAAARCNDLILTQSQSPEIPVTMGTTVVITIIRGGLCQVVHAGDSRAYLLARDSMRQLTHDHSIVQELLDCGKITPEQAYNHPNKNIITSALCVDANTQIDYNESPIGKGDILLVCTDGLTNMVREEVIAPMLRDADFFRTADRLVEKAIEAGGFDNITAVVLEA